jgi:hypothetical protein
MADLVLSRTQALARQHRDQIQSIVEVTQAAQRELGRVHTKVAEEAIYTLTYTRDRIQTAARNGASEAEVARWVEEQKLYLATTQRIVNQGAAGLQAVVRNLPALPGPGSSR